MKKFIPMENFVVKTDLSMLFKGYRKAPLIPSLSWADNKASSKYSVLWPGLSLPRTKWNKDGRLSGGKQSG
uniref:Uncharacterized protein n=1 Tax=Oryza brachyantha TaxID=4533 RepID=J3N0R3_ORYBR